MMPNTSASRPDPDFEVLPPEQPGGSSGLGGKNDPFFALIAHVMDGLFRIPGTKIRLGLDPLIGLIPGFGDTAGALVSLLLIFRGMQAGLPKVVLLRMVGNVALNAGVGAIPVIGDAFSVWFRSNRLNYELYQRHAGRRVAPQWQDKAFAAALIGGLLLLVALFVTLGVTLATALWKFAWGGR